MTRIGLLSDTHGYIDDRILHYLKDCDEVWHAGDIGDVSVTDKITETHLLRAVYGNIDGGDLRKQFKLNERFFCEKVDVWITHIGGYPGRYAPDVRELIYKNPPKLFICGHSHILKVMFDKKLNLLHINPGASGKHGFHKIRTLVKFTIDDTNIKDLEVVELGKK